MGSELVRGEASDDSLPPCGGGLGWGVVPRGTEVPQRTTPTPNPSPQGGGEEFAASLRANLTFIELASETHIDPAILLMNGRR